MHNMGQANGSQTVVPRPNWNSMKPSENTKGPRSAINGVKRTQPLRLIARGAPSQSQNLHTLNNNKKNITSKPSISPHMKSWTSWNNSFKKIHCNLKRNCVKPYPLTQSNLVVWLVPSGIGLWPFVDTLTSRPHQWTGRLCHYQARVHHPKLCSRVATKSTGQSPSSYIKSFGTCYWKLNLTFNLKTGNPGSQSQQVFDPGNGADIVRIWKFDVEAFWGIATINPCGLDFLGCTKQV